MKISLHNLKSFDKMDHPLWHDPINNRNIKRIDPICFDKMVFIREIVWFGTAQQVRSACHLSIYEII